MLLIAHVGVALTSVAYTLFAYVYPSHFKLSVTYALTALTLASGTALALLNPASLPQACTAGIIYLQIIVVAIFLLRRKLARLAISRETIETKS